MIRVSPGFSKRIALEAPCHGDIEQATFQLWSQGKIVADHLKIRGVIALDIASGTSIPSYRMIRHKEILND